MAFALTTQLHSNTGRYKGAIKMLEEHLDRSILWIMCRIFYAMEALTGQKIRRIKANFVCKNSKLLPEVQSNTIEIMSPEEDKLMGIAADIVACVNVPHYLKSTVVTRAANIDILQIQSLIRVKSTRKWLLPFWIVIFDILGT